MKEEFEFGELVEVRSREDLEWRARVYAGTMEHTELHWCMKDGQDKTTYNGRPVPWLHIRKIQPEHHYLLGDIEIIDPMEERLDKLEAILNGAIAHLNKQIASLKKSLK